MPFVHVHWYEGRSDEQKAEIAKRIEAALIEVAGVSPDHCWVKFDDSKKSDFIIGEKPTDRARGGGASSTTRSCRTANSRDRGAPQ
jgi:phenylpyruvate tautomerase PptA (4-oxalocrotonate tautomerase family)